MMKTKVLTMCVVATAMACSVANATTVNMAWGASFNSPPTMTGAAVVGSAGDEWNQLFAPNFSTPASPGPVFSNMIDSDGNATGYSLYSGANGGWMTRQANSSVWQGTGYEGLMNGMNLNASEYTDYTWTVQNLPANSAWDLYIYIQGDSAATGRSATFNIDGVAQTSNPADGADNTFILNKNYLLFSGVTADNAGDLDILWRSNSGEANWNGMQMVGAPVPLPATVWLFGSAIGLLGWMRRKTV